MRIITYIILLTVVINIGGCKKWRLEKLSGTWAHDYYDVPNDGYRTPLKYTDINFTCDSFRMKQYYYDDVPTQEDWISGTYSIHGTTLELSGVYEDSVYINHSNSSQILTNFHASYKIGFIGDKLNLKPIDTYFRDKMVWKKQSEIDCF